MLTGNAGVSCCLMNTPSGAPDEVAFAKNIIQAAKENKYPSGKFTHLVFSSLLQPALTGIGPHAKGKLAIEELILESGVPYTIVHVAPQMDEVVTSDVINGYRTTIPTLLDPTMDSSYISREDLGHALGRILALREHHHYATYQLVGTVNPLGMNEIAGKVQTILGHRIETKRLYVVENTEQIRKGKLTFSAERLRALKDETGTFVSPEDEEAGKNTPEEDIPPLDITTQRVREHVEDGGVPLPALAAEQEETPTSRRRALSPGAARPTFSELGEEDRIKATADQAESPEDEHDVFPELFGASELAHATIAHGPQGQTSQEKQPRMDSLAHNNAAYELAVASSSSLVPKPLNPTTHAQVHGPPPASGAVGNISGAEISANKGLFAGPPIYANVSMQKNQSSSSSEGKGPVISPSHKIIAYRQSSSNALLYDPRVIDREETAAEITYRHRLGISW